jgi:hypothetical protein
MNPIFRANQHVLELGQSTAENRLANFHAFLRKHQEAARWLRKQSGADVAEERLSRDLDRVLREELEALPQHRHASPDELNQLVNNISERTADRMQSIMESRLRDTYVRGLQDVATGVGVSMAFSPRHERSFQQALSEETLADTFASFTNEQARTIREVILEAYRDGRVSPGRISSRLVQEIGHEVRSQLERIASTETWKVYQTARDEAYDEAEERTDRSFLYEFGTVNDEKTCDVCRVIMEESEGGIPKPELKELIIDVSTGQHPEYPDLGNPSWDPVRDDNFPLPHPRCRHRHFRTGIVEPEQERGDGDR